MPGNGFTFPIWVSCENERIRLFQRLDNIVDPGFGFGIHCPIHIKILFGPHTAVFGRQVANMPETGQNFIILAQIFFDCFGFSRGFDDNKFHENTTYGENFGDNCGKMLAMSTKGEK